MYGIKSIKTETRTDDELMAKYKELIRYGEIIFNESGECSRMLLVLYDEEIFSVLLESGKVIAIVGVRRV